MQTKANALAIARRATFSLPRTTFQVCLSVHFFESQYTGFTCCAGWGMWWLRFIPAFFRALDLKGPAILLIARS